MSSASLVDLAYQHLSDGLCSGRLAAGDQISENLLSKELQISRTPVREAIRRLQAEGLVNQIPKIGTFVRTPSRREVVELYEQREALETYLARRLAERSSVSTANELLSLCDQMSALISEGKDSGGVLSASSSAGRIRSIDIAFHETLARDAGNQLIYRSLFDGRVMSRVFTGRLKMERFISVAEHEKAVKEHRLIAKAIRDGDAESAYGFMSEHISLALSRSLSLLDSQVTVQKDDRFSRLMSDDAVEGDRSPA
ncbi:MAG: GntR family transcriptional regulator [Planctomycetota bacterium]